jgi:hypothetical protein
MMLLDGFDEHERSITALRQKQARRGTRRPFVGRDPRTRELTRVRADAEPPAAGEKASRSPC